MNFRFQIILFIFIKLIKLTSSSSSSFLNSSSFISSSFLSLLSSSSSSSSYYSSSFKNDENNSKYEYCLKYSSKELCEVESSKLCLNCSNFTNKNKKEDIELNLLISQFPHCKTGFSRKGHIASIQEKNEDKCINRGYDNRESLERTWKGLSLKYIHSSIDLIQTVFNSFSTDTDIVDLVFLGDSVSTQLSQFLICDLLRLKIPSTTPLNTYVESFNHTTTEFRISPTFLQNFLRNKSTLNSHYIKINKNNDNNHNKIKSLRIHNKQFNIPCANLQGSLDCRENINTSKGKEKMMDQVTNYSRNLLQYFLNSSNLDKNLQNNHYKNQFNNSWNEVGKKSISRETYIFVNYGLHLRKAHRNWALEGLVKAIYQQQEQQQEQEQQDLKLKSSQSYERSIKNYLLWRETSTQAFGYSLDGLYEWDKKDMKIDGFCCQFPSIDPRSIDWRTQDVLNSFNELDRNWSKSIGWIPFFDSSILLSDLRIEYDYKFQLIDCTHFIYSPVAYEILWWQMSNSINKLKYYEKNQETN